MHACIILVEYIELIIQYFDDFDCASSVAVLFSSSTLLFMEKKTFSAVRPSVLGKFEIKDHKLNQNDTMATLEELIQVSVMGSHPMHSSARYFCSIDKVQVSISISMASAPIHH
jgi:hypothetical protein